MLYINYDYQVATPVLPHEYSPKYLLITQYFYPVLFFKFIPQAQDSVLCLLCY
jgi:hypothetical protein